MKYRSLLAILGLCAGQAAWADLTMRHTIEFKFASFLPPAAMDAMKAQLGDQVPKETIVHIKGRKTYTSMGRMVMIGDLASGVITLMDSKERRFATSTMASYADKIAARQKLTMPVMPPEAQQIFDKIQFAVKTDHTGQTATIQGIAAEENVLTISIEIPNPAGQAMQMRMEMHLWTARADEVDRIPALKELEMSATLPKEGMDPVEFMTKSMASFPGMADKMRGAMQEIMKNAGKAQLRIQTAIYLPAMAQMAGRGGGEANQPLVEYTIELAELSSASLPDTRFEVPAGYQAAPMEELMAALFPIPKAAMPAGRPSAAAQTGGQFETQTQAPPKAETPAGQPPPVVPGPSEGVYRVGGGVAAPAYRVGGGVSAPALLSKVEPAYTEEARAAKVQGTVLLFVVVGTDGKAQQMRVLRSLDTGLDQKAIEAVANWIFKPGMKDGKPVSVQAQIEVNFRLLDK